MIELKLKKGFNLNLYGETEELLIQASYPERVAVKPVNFTGIRPALDVKTGDAVKGGSVLFHDKDNHELVFTSPLSGIVEDIIRGERRILEAIVIRTDGKNSTIPCPIPQKNIKDLNRNEIIKSLLKCGLFPVFKQRPFSKTANPHKLPRDVFISAMNTAPLSPDNNMVVYGNEDNFQAGLDIISRLTDGKVYLAVDRKREDNSHAFINAKNVELCMVSGPHPAGNSGVHIHHISPIRGKTDIVWTCTVQSVIWIGSFFKNRKFFPETTVSVAGSAATGRAYYKTFMGASIKSFISERTRTENTRFISGDVLTGQKISYNGYVGFYDNMITVIPEPDRDKLEFLGWAEPGFDKYSRSMTFLSNYIRFGNKFIQSARRNGSKRAFIATGIYEEVLPMDIYPVFLIKSIIGGDIEEMEGLGIYELAEEDIAICEYVDPSKNLFQDILRKGLDLADREG